MKRKEIIIIKIIIIKAKNTITKMKRIKNLIRDKSKTNRQIIVKKIIKILRSQKYLKMKIAHVKKYRF